MAMYMTMVRFTHQEARGISNFCKEWQDSAKRIEGLGIKIVGTYGILGPYDMTFIYEAPNEEKAASVPLSISYLDPGIQTETWTVIPMEDFASISAKLSA
ncbi:MAG: GYD domain-containing protein [Dehalococcoidia bacterium]|nr:GYD domain-containing protein [Dehalococcoidia bacterium]